MFRDVVEGRLLRKKISRKRCYKVLDDLVGSGSYEEMKQNAIGQNT